MSCDPQSPVLWLHFATPRCAIDGSSDREEGSRRCQIYDVIDVIIGEVLGHGRRSVRRPTGEATFQ